MKHSLKLTTATIRVTFGALMLLASHDSFLGVAATRSPANTATETHHLRNHPVKRRAAEALDFDMPDGIWTSRGYGYVLNVTNGIAEAIIEETAISCIRNPLLLWDVEDVSVEGDIATVTESGGAAPYTFDRTDSFQAGCANGITPNISDALVVFDVLDETFVEHYAFFELRNIDWDTMASEARSNLSSNSTDEQLFGAFTSILGPLDDGHVGLASDTDFFSSKPDEINVQLMEEFEQQNEIADIETYMLIQLGTLIQIINTYMDGGLNGEPGGFVWGSHKNSDTSIGYMQLLNFAPDANDAFFTELDAAFVALADTDAMVFDIRVNGGGLDTIALKIASYFTSERTLAFTKRAVDGNGFTDTAEVYIEPGTGPTYENKKVVVVVSGSTVSAAEIFTLAMAQLPHTVLFGRNTSGALSDALKRILPNGWTFTLSNEVYASPDGTIYEADGVPPVIFPVADLLPLSEREAGIDSWLEHALQEAADNSPVPTLVPTSDASAVAIASSWKQLLWVASVMWMFS